MRSAILCILVGFFLCAAAPFAQAASTVFLRAQVQSPVWHEDVLRISLTPDEKACQAAYGDDWKQICQYWSSAFGASTRGVKLSPAQPGQWSRTDAGDLIFSPQGTWLTDTAFTVDLKDVQLAPHRKITNPSVGFKTLPLAAEVPPGKLWIDPDSKGEHALSFDLRFTTPPDRAKVEKNLHLQATAGAKLGAPSFVWTEKDTRLLVKSRILALPSAEGEARFTLPQVRGLAKQNGRWQLLKGTAGQSLVLPGATEIFRVTQMRVEPWQNPALETEYHLVLRTSLRVTPEALLPHLTVVELPRQRSEENLRPIAWESTVPVARDIAAGRPLKPRAFRVEGESADIVRFVLPVTPGSYVFCQIAAGFGPSPQYRLLRPATLTAHAARPESTVVFLQPGNVLVLPPPKGTSDPKGNATPQGTLEDEAQLSLMSRDVDSLRWRVQRISTARPDVFRSWGTIFGPQYFDEDIESTGPAVEGIITPVMEKSGLGFSTLNLAPALQKLGVRGLFHVEVLGFVKGDLKGTAAKILLLTDMGMVAKKTPDGRRHIFVCSLETGQPMAGARVRALGKNGLPVAQVVTDAEGKATLPALEGLTREKRPVAITAEYGEENQSGVGQSLSWMRLDDPETQVDYSRFPTKGQLSAGGGLNAYVFAQRGIFRPGEKLHFGVMVRRGDWKLLPDQFPLVATLRDPAGRVLLRRPFNAASGLMEQDFTVPEAAPTGLYRLGISTPPASGSLEEEGDLIGSGAARVEEFEPDTLEIKTDVAPTAATVPAGAASSSALPAGWLRPGADGGQLRVSLRNLYGLPAAGRRIKAEVRVQAAPLHFPGYADFTFPDILPWQGEGLTLNLPEAHTDEDGHSTLLLGLDRLRQGTLRCSVLVEGFELGGGRGVSTTKEFLVSPMPYMVGYRLQGAVTNLDFVPKGAQGGLEFLAVNEALQEHNPGPLTFELARRRYVTALTTDSSGQYAFEESPVDTRLASSTLSMNAKGRLVWPLPSKDPGQYLLTVRTADNTILARLPFTVAGDDDMRPGLVRQDEKLPGTQLRMSLNKENYAPGETAQVYLASPYEGVGLITLERDSVAAHKWFRLAPGNNVLSFPIPADFEGRGYLNVSLARHASSPDIFVQPYSFALAPLTVNAAGRDMDLALAAPALALPGQNMQVRLAAGTAGKVIVFAVDEGVLQLTRFTTPDPLRYLLLDRALEVQTFQWLDSIMPGHAQLEARLRKARAAFGGGMDLSGGRFHNPFKRRHEPPLAWWSGIRDVGKEGLTLSIPLPDYYSGKVRVMAVGLSANNVGHTETTSTVRGPLTLTPQLPLMAAPGDTFETSLILRNTGDSPLQLKLALDLPQNLTAAASLPASLTLAPQAEAVAPLRLTAGQEPGAANLTFTATDASGQVSTRRASLSLRPALPLSHSLAAGNTLALATKPATGKNSRKTAPQTSAQGAADTKKTQGPLVLPLHRDLHAYGAEASLTVSSLPLPALRGLLRYLENYPYACVEQSLSRALPLALLHTRPALDSALRPGKKGGNSDAERAERKAEAQKTLERASSALQNSLTGNGLSLWGQARSGDSNEEDRAEELLLTAYGADYALALREAGIPLPGYLTQRLLDALENGSNNEARTLSEGRAQAYALWVLSRAGVITTQRLEMLTRALEGLSADGTKNLWRMDVTAALMAGSYAALRMDRHAQALLTGVHLDAADKALAMENGLMDSTAARGLMVAVLARHFPQQLANTAPTLALELTRELNAPRGATFAAAQGARALLLLSSALQAEGTDAAAQKAGMAKNPPAADTALEAVALSCAHRQSWSQEAPATSPRRAEGMLSLDDPGCAAFRLDMGGTALPLFWELSSAGYDQNLPQKAQAQGLEVTRSISAAGKTLEQGAADTPLHAELGSVLRVELKARAEGAEKREVVLLDLLPGGFEMLWQHPDNSNTGSGVLVDRRDDRFIVHANLGSEEQSFVYHVRVAHKGDFALPPVMGEGLFDRALRGNGPAGRVKVE